MKRLAFVLTLAAMLVSAVPVSARSPMGEAARNYSDDLPNYMGERQRDMRRQALEKVLRGEEVPRGPNKVVNLAPQADGPVHKPKNGKYVELAFEGEDQILTLLGEFGPDPATHDAWCPRRHQPWLAIRGPRTTRSLSPTGTWSQHHDLAERTSTSPTTTRCSTTRTRIRPWRTTTSSSRRGRTPLTATSVTGSGPEQRRCLRQQLLRQHRLHPRHRAVHRGPGGRVVGRLVAQQGSVGAANAFLATFDVWDRYDYDGDGNFDEPDGYIDHFQSVHAGEGEETGGGAQGEDAIWSHRSYCNCDDLFGTGPDRRRPVRRRPDRNQQLLDRRLHGRARERRSRRFRARVRP